MGQLVKLSGKSGALLHRAGIGAGFRLLSRYADILIIPWVLELPVVMAYLLARSASLCVPSGLALLERKVAPHLDRLARNEKQNLFRAAAARVNLGYVMVCGAIALIVMSFAPYAVNSIAGIDPSFDDILIWLLIGQCAPALFGATALLMRAVERGAFYELLMAVTSVMFLAGVAVLDEKDGALIAQTFAAAQLTHAGICALLLTQCGVWPGLTALFHRKIRLF